MYRQVILYVQPLHQLLRLPLQLLHQLLPLPLALNLKLPRPKQERALRLFKSKEQGKFFKEGTEVGRGLRCVIKGRQNDHEMEFGETPLGASISFGYMFTWTRGIMKRTLGLSSINFCTKNNNERNTATDEFNDRLSVF